MDTVSIKLKIGNREYPLKVQKDEEDRVRKAAKMVNDRIKEYEQQFGASDKYDHLAMCAIQMATELVNISDSAPAERENLSSLIAEIDSKVSAYLK